MDIPEKMPLGMTKKQQEILDLLFQFRFLQRQHVQRFLRHTNHRRINQWLTQLKESEYIGREYPRAFRLLNEPATYFLAKKGIRLFQTQFPQNQRLQTLRRERTVSYRTKNHAFFMADFYLLLREYFDKEYQTSNFYTQAYIPHRYRIQIIRPDALLHTHDGLIYFLEFDREQETITTMRQKMKSYLQYYQSNLWRRFAPSFFPCVCVISLSSKRVSALVTQTEQLLLEAKRPPMVYKFTTFAQLQAKGFRNNTCLTPFHSSQSYPFL